MAKKPQTISQYVKDFVEDASINLRPYITQGKLNNEFIQGKQNKKVNQRSLTIEDKVSDPNVYLERKVFNRILPIYLTRYGILTQNMPIPGIKPIGNTAKEIEDSKKANDFILRFITETNFRDKFNTAVRHVDVYGLEWFKTGIDWTDGDQIAEVEIETDSGEKGKLTVKEGKVFAMPVPIHEIFIRGFHIETMEEVDELVHRRAFTTEYIKKRWGFEAKKEDIKETGLPTYPKYSDIGYLTGQEIEHAYIYEYYKKPDALYPEGRYIVVCNDKILWDNKLPFVNAKDGKRKIPFDFVALQTVPHHTVGITVYQQIIPIQETYNAVKNRYLEYVNHIAIGQMFVWEGSLVNKNSFSTKPGKIVTLKRNTRKPEAILKDKLSMEFINYLKTLEDDMLIAAGLSQMTAYGINKAAVRTDGVADKVSESDENKLVNAIDNLSECLIKMFRKLVYLEQHREDVLHEKLKVAKLDTPALQHSLKGINAEHITIVNREFLMQSDQTIDKKFQQALSIGIYSPQAGIPYASKLELLNSMRANFLQDTLDPMERATHNLVVEENMMMLHSKTVADVMEFHRHDQHIAEHELFRISPEVRRLAQEKPAEYKALIDAMDVHVDKHQKFKADQVDPYQQKAQMQQAKDAVIQASRNQGGPRYK